jgi:hypothetical protein
MARKWRGEWDLNPRAVDCTDLAGQRFRLPRLKYGHLPS